MENREFNLLDERWIRVRYPDCREEEVSLRQVFAHAHGYAGLAGETSTQDMAMLRFLLAVLHSVFYRVDEKGNPAPVKSKMDAFDRWKNLWELGRFPQYPIENYLNQWRDRFWLFDEEHPFYQVPRLAPEMKNVKVKPIDKIIGEISEGENKKRLFPSRTKKERQKLSYAETARWLLFVNAYDDTALKSPKADGDSGAKKEKKLSISPGWLGRLGLITAQGATLFETLMLNFVLLDGNKKPWGEPQPVWELDTPRCGERTKIPMPDDQASLLTLQSRRVFLERQDGMVTGFGLLGGDILDTVNCTAEQMTIWKNTDNGLVPRKHSYSRHLWQDFASIAAKETYSEKEKTKETAPSPGIVIWHELLSKRKILNIEFIRYRSVGMEYSSPQTSAIVNTFEDSLSFHLNLLTELGEAWTNSITSAVRLCDEVANQVGQLAKNLVLAAGGSDSDADGDVQRAKEQFYYRVDMPFRAWLQTLDASQSDTVREERMKDWTEQALEIAGRLGQDLIAQAGPAAYHGRTITKNNKDTFFAAPEVYRWFKNALYKYKDKGDQQ